MKRVLFSRSSVVALALMAATIGSWLVFENHLQHTYASLIFISILVLKVWAILYEFMELSSQDFVWKIVFNIWVVVMGLVLAFSFVG